MKVWIIVRGILFGIVKLAGALVMLGFSLGVIAGRKLKANSLVSLEDGQSAPGDMTKDKTNNRMNNRTNNKTKNTTMEMTQAVTNDMTKAIENAGEQVIKDLEERTMVAVRLLDEAEEKIARLKNMLGIYEEQVLEEQVLEEQTSQGECFAKDESEQELSAYQPSQTVITDEKPSAKKHALVFELAGKGLSVQKIAKQVGIGCGEVELILSLNTNEGQ